MRSTLKVLTLCLITLLFSFGSLATNDLKKTVITPLDLLEWPSKAIGVLNGEYLIVHHINPDTTHDVKEVISLFTLGNETKLHSYTYMLGNKQFIFSPENSDTLATTPTEKEDKKNTDAYAVRI